MDWTTRLQGIEPFYVSTTHNTRVYTYSSPSTYGPTVVVKQVTCADVAAAEKAEKEAEFGMTNRHPPIHECLGWEREPNPPSGFFVYIFSVPMPKSLFDEITERARSAQYFPEEQLWSYYHQMLDAFSFLQDLNIVHRDIKPHNMLLDPQGQVKVCDFGFAKEVIREGGPATLLMTPAYSTPALRIAKLRGDKVRVDHDMFKSDVFSMLDLPKKIAELPELQTFIDTKLDQLRDRYSETWVNQLRLMLRVDEDQRPDFRILKAPALYADDEYLPPVQGGEEGKDPLTLTVRCGLPSVRVGPQQAEEVPCMVSLKGREQDPSVRTYSVDFMCVIDQSGSMAGPLITLVKASLTGLLGILGDRDRVCIVGFNNTAERKCPLIRCTSEGKTHLQTFIQALTCTGCTNISHGFLMGLEVLKRRQTINQAVSLLLFSDGQNNMGGDPTVPCTSALQQAGIQRLTVSTFGYGPGLDVKLLEALASLGKGQFHHITEQKQIQQVFTLAIRNATTVVARKLQVSLRLLEPRVPCDITKVYAKDAGNLFELPDLQANEQKELVFLLKPHYIELAKHIAPPVVEVSLNYKDNEDTDSYKNATLSVKFVKWEGNHAATEDSGVYRHWYRVRGADYLYQARELANAGHFREADEVLHNGIQALQGGSCKQIPLVQSVLHDLIAARDLVQSNTTWQRGGDPHFASISYSHFSQAATVQTLHYASKQQAVQLTTIPELSDTETQP